MRTAGVGDAEAIARIHVDTWRAAYRGLMPAELLDRLDVTRRAEFWRKLLAVSSGSTFVVEVEGAVLGFCNTCPARDPDLDSHVSAELTAIYVDAHAWGKGYGRQLCERAMAEASHRGFTSMALWVLERNARARAFYARLGFSLDSARKIDETSGLAEIRYKRPLPGG